MKITYLYSQYIMYLCCSFQYETISLFKWLERVNARFVHAVEYRLQNVVQTVDTDAKKKYLFQKPQLNVQYSIY